MAAATSTIRHQSQAGFPEWFDATAQRRLERFALAFRRGTTQHGEFRSVRRGGQQEFLEHRPYAVGDDLKFLDWNVFGRLNTLAVKTYARELNSTVAVLVDSSASMQFSTGSHQRSPRRRKQANRPRLPETKFEAALFCTAVIGYLALAGGVKGGGGNRLRVAVADGPEDKPRFFTERTGRAGFLSLMRDLASESQPAGSEFAAYTDKLSRLPQLSGPVFVLTDGYEAPAQQSALARLAARPDVPVVVVQLLTPQELNPQGLDGAASLVNSETGHEVAIVDSPGTQKLYRDALGQFVDGWKNWCSHHSVFHVVVTADSSLLDNLLTGFHRTGVVV